MGTNNKMQYLFASSATYERRFVTKRFCQNVTFHHSRHGSVHIWGTILGMPVCRELLLSRDVKAFNQCMFVIAPDEAIVGGNAAW